MYNLQSTAAGCKHVDTLYEIYISTYNNAECTLYVIFRLACCAWQYFAERRSVKTGFRRCATDKYSEFRPYISYDSNKRFCTEIYVEWDLQP